MDEKRINASKTIKNLSPRAKRNLRLVFFAAVMLLFFELIYRFGMARMKANYLAAEQDAYYGIYQEAFDWAERQNHVSNAVVISVDGTQKISRLEVLTVNGTEFVIKNADENDKTISWLEVQGTGIFTVDLSAGEFIADSERQYVLVRIPKPMLTECTVSATGKQFWKDGHIIANGSVAEGVRLSQKQLSEGRLKLEDSMKQSRAFYEAAEAAAQSIIDSLVKQWNPNIPDLQVIVEFRESF